MRVLQMVFAPIRGSKHLWKIHCQVVDKPFTWVMANGVYALPDVMDAGPIDPMAIPLPVFENWKQYGEDANGKSMVIPDHIDLDGHGEAHRDLRLFGTLDMVSVIARQEFKNGDEGLKAFLQFLLRTVYVSRTSDFTTDLMPIAVQELVSWDKASIYAFVARTMGKNAKNVSVADVAHVVGVITGQRVDITANGFDLMKAVSTMSPLKAATEKPDEFFTAAFPQELMEVEVIKDCLITVEDEFYFGKGSKWPKHWEVKGPEGVSWKCTVEKDMTTWAPAAGTLYDRAVGSKKRMFAEAEGDVPFALKLEDCKVMDTGAFEIKPRDFETGIRYLAIDTSLPLYKVTLAPVDVATLSKDLAHYGAQLQPEPTLDDIVQAVEHVYLSHKGTIDQIMNDKHLMVFDTGLGVLGNSPDSVDEWKSMENSTKVDKLDVFLLPGMRAALRSFLTYVWVLKHTDSETFCYAGADNDDFSVQAAIEHAVQLATVDKKTLTVFLVGCSYSLPFNGRKVRTTAFKSIDQAIAFDIT